MKLSSNTALVQGIYLLIVGLWPVLDSVSFMAITGPKVDVWVLKVTGALMAIIGFVLLHARQKTVINSSLAMLGMLTAAVIAIFEIYYVSRGIIRSIYLLDAIIEIVFFLMWALSMYMRRMPERKPA